jgi:rhodanese-related sulfurtransferase
MKAKKLWPLLTALVALSMLFAACGGQPAEPSVAEPTEEMAAPTEEPAPAEPEPTEPAFSEADLDAAFKAFLAGMEKYNTISLEALNEMLAEEPPPFLLDVRSESEVQEKGRIEGSVVIPLRELGKHIDLLPSFDTTIVSYCGSGWRCTIAAAALEALGWENVLALKGGSYGGWVEAGYPTVEGMPEMVPLNAAQPDPALLAVIDEMLSNIPEGWGVITADELNQQLIENPDLILLDVRRADELEAKGAIEGAIHIPLEEFIERKGEWPAEKDAPIVVYCGSGHRSTLAMTILWTYGYTDVHSLKGGFSAWAEAGYPVVEVAAP